MQTSCYNHLLSHPDQHEFVRRHPVWYRYLSRDPNRLSELNQVTKAYFGKTFTKRVEKLGSQMQLAQMLLQFASIRD